MKNTIVVALIAFVINVNAQDEHCFNKGTSVFNLGAGVGSSISYSYYHNNVTPILNFSYECGVAKAGPGTVGIGVAVSYMAFSNSSRPTEWFPMQLNSQSNFFNVAYSSTSILAGGLRASYHPDFCNRKKYDVYAAVQLNVYSQNPNLSNINHAYLSPCLLIGVRYFPIPNVGVFAELGNDFAVLKGGLSVKFGGNKTKTP